VQGVGGSRPISLQRRSRVRTVQAPFLSRAMCRLLAPTDSRDIGRRIPVAEGESIWAALDLCVPCPTWDLWTHQESDH